MEPNFRVGQYVLDRRLGEGGMGEVWLARNVHLGMPAAIKFLNSDFAGKSEIEQRFLNEGRRQGALSHPNIIKVYGFEYVEGRSFLILQYVDGESLDFVLRRTGRLGTAEALRIGICVLNALDFAHGQDIVHRDIKPSNILLDKHGFVYLGDFGIVLAVNERRITRTGTSMGTALYMSPEQIRKPGSVDRRSDIYSFGCVLYEMLAGEPPFNPPGTGEEDSDFAIKMAHVQEPPPSMRLHNPSVSAEIEAVATRCLAKNPDERYATCREVREALSAAMVSRSFAERPAVVDRPPPRTHTVVEIPAIVTRPAAGAVRVNPKDGLTYVWIPPGVFLMGCSPGDDECADDERPSHEVTITKGFWMGQAPVTQEAYERVTGRNTSRFKGPQRPVENVAWQDAQTYCQVVGVRLPTEAEWEYAARAGSASPSYGALDSVAWYGGNSGSKTHGVGQKLANAYGLRDTLGNVWEWTADWYAGSYYESSPPVDPRGPPSGKYRVLRGGSWDDGPALLRVSGRGRSGPDNRFNVIGFRCVWE